MKKLQTDIKMDSPTISADLNNKEVDLTKQRKRLEMEGAFNIEVYRASIVNFIGYVFAGYLAWIWLHFIFNSIWPSLGDVPEHEIRVKDLWNIMMYAIPYTFWTLAAKHFTIAFIYKGAIWLGALFSWLKTMFINKAGGDIQ
ncbi:hypothetical protein NTP67_21815 (plasmid) [Providencia rettgeri]|uniref:hypothetical protein n=1 Tax=Providencia rettgeri TaxID=587 RepID=UPI00221F03F3|nr:hypothetical protein [Providencia rettgeri]EMB3084043.1 hypothetical protein [Providencia rettgeri]MDU7496166.1 hypothetical protein [Providencia rettgeri]UYV43806.1 hypothetical protein NTP67_21815 [Providencia rettgeri]